MMRKFIKNQLFAVPPATVAAAPYDASSFPSTGISLNFLLANLAAEECLTMAELAESVKNATFRSKSTFVELVASCYPGAVSNTVDCYVVFPSSEPPSEFLGALEKYKARRRRSDLILWIAPFCLNLHVDKQRLLQDSYATTTFVKAFSGFDRVLLVAHPVYLPSALRRLWCIFEIYLTIAQKKTLDLCFNSEKSPEEVKALASNFEEIAAYFTGVKSRECGAADADEKSQILGFLDEMKGCERVDEVLNNRLRQRFSEYVEMVVKRLRNTTTLEKELCKLLFSLSQFYAKERQYALSCGAMKKALDLCERVFGLVSPTTASCYMGLAMLYFKEGDIERAAVCAGQAYEIHETIAAERQESLAESKNPDIPRVLDILGRAQMKLEKYGDSEDAFQAAIDLWVSIRGEDDIHVASSRENLADLYMLCNQLNHAFEQYSIAVQVLTNLFGENDHRLTGLLTKMAKVRKEMGNFPKAEHLLRKALANVRMAFQSNLAVHTSMYNLAYHLVETNKLGEAEGLHRMAIEGWRSSLGESHPAVGSALCNLASICKAQGMFREAEDFYKESIEHARKHLPPQDLRLGVRLNGLAALYSENEMLRGKAEKIGKEALRLARRSLGEDHPTTALYKRNWG